MHNQGFQRVVWFSRRKCPAMSALWGWSILAGVCCLGLVLLTGLLADLIHTGGNASLSEADYALVRDHHEASFRSADGTAHFTNRGLLPLVLRLEGSPLGPMARRLYRGVPWLQQDLPCLATLIMGVVLLATCTLWLRKVYLQAVHIRAVTAANALRVEVLDQANRLAASDVLSRKPHDPFKLANEETALLEQGLIRRWSVVPFVVPSLAALVFVAAALQIWIAVAAVLLGLWAWLTLRPWNRKTAGQAQALLTESRRGLNPLQELFRRTHLLGGQLMGDSSKQAAQEVLQTYKTQTLQAFMERGKVFPRSAMVALLSAALLFGLAGVNTLRDFATLPVAGLGMLIAALAGMGLLMSVLVRAWHPVNAVEQAAADIFGYLDLVPPVGESPHAKPLEPIVHDLRFEHVSVTDASGRTCLEDVTVEIPASLKIAVFCSEDRTPRVLVGLLTRQFDPAQGKIVFDDADLKDCQLHSVRQQVWAADANSLFEDLTLADNISLGDPQVLPRHVNRAAERVHIYEAIQALPGGMASRVGEEAKLLPHEALRVVLARALIHKPSLLLIQEPSIGWTLAAEEALDKAYNKVAMGRTLIIFATRMATLRTADRILVFHEGKLHASGRHAELLHKCDLYRHLQYIRFNEFRPKGDGEQNLMAS